MLTILTFPFDFIRQLTIPMFTAETWDRLTAALNPPLIGLFIPLSQESKFYVVWDGWVFLGSGLLGLALGVLIWCTSTRSVLPPYNFALVLAGFVMSVLWICIVCSVLVDLLSLTGLVLKVSPALLGITFLAWGNSAGDYSANPAVAKIGLEQAAITACFAGPLFNMLVGLGVSLIISSASSPVKFPLFEHKSVLITLVFLIGSNVVSLVGALLTKGRFTKVQGVVLGGLYCGFVVFLVAVMT